jgi:ABC-2 type transport system permease protein
LPISVLVIACFSLGLALILCRYAVFFPDVAEMYQIILTAWMYITPIIFPMDMFPKQFGFVLALNPMTWMVRIFRSPIYDGRIPTTEEFLVALAWGLGTLMVGWVLFTRKSDEYAYRV